MPTKLLSLLIVIMLSLTACGQLVTPIAPDQAASKAGQSPTTLPSDNPSVTTSVDPKPVSTSVGGGAYWVASVYKGTDGRFNVFIVQPLGEAAPETIFQPDREDIPSFLHWSSDGLYLFFAVYKGEEHLTQAFYLYDRVNRQLQRFDFQQMMGRQGRVTRIDWSPDTQSKQLVFSLCAALFTDCTLWLANLDKGTAVQLKDQGEDWIWDTDGKSMLFEKEMMEAPVRFNLETMTEEELTMPSRSLLSPEGGSIRLYGFFPNLGGYLFSRSNDKETRDFYLISETGNQETLLFQTQDGWNSELIQPPVLSPDGRQIGLNFFSEEYEPTLVIGSLENLPLPVPAAPEPQRGLALLWSPDNSIYVTLVALEGVTELTSLGFYEAHTSDLLQVYQPPAPYKLTTSPGTSGFGGIQRLYYYAFDSIWIP